MKFLPNATKNKQPTTALNVITLTIKMTILPRFLYLFQMLPVYLPKSFFKQLDRLISVFIWNKSPSRIKKASLERPKSEGGFIFKKRNPSL